MISRETIKAIFSGTLKPKNETKESKPTVPADSVKPTVPADFVSADFVSADFVYKDNTSSKTTQPSPNTSALKTEKADQNDKSNSRQH